MQMSPYHVRALICTLGSILVGIVASNVGASIPESILIAAVIDILAIQITDIDSSEQQMRRLAKDLGLNLTIHDSAYKPAIERLVNSLSHVERQRYPLFLNWADDNLTSWAAQVADIGNGHLRITNPSEIQERGRWLLKNLKRELFATSFVSMEQFWTANKGPEYQRENVELAKEHKLSITRVFLFTSPTDLYSPKFQGILETLRQQAAAGLEVLYAYTDSLPEEARVDFGLWDNAMVCYITADPNDPAVVQEANYYTDVAHLQQARRIVNTIRDNAAPIEEVLSEQELALSAIKMKTEAPDYCIRGTHSEGASCAWYHSSWQFLRLLDMVETPQLHNGFFVPYVRKLAQTSTSLSILICGLADYEMLRVVCEALEAQPGGDHQVRVVDMCDTPIRATEWWLDRNHPRVKVITTTGFAEDTKLLDASFDLVVTDAFISKLAYHRQQYVVNEWRRILKPGGEVLTTLKLSAHGGKNPISATPDQLERYVERASSKLKARHSKSPGVPAPFPISDEEVKDLAREYGRRNVSYPVDSAILQELFAGFDVEVIDAPQVEEYAVTSYAQVVAVKREQT
jgi:SAM-dependent methyltransferase